jgi:hypothetical protein
MLVLLNRVSYMCIISSQAGQSFLDISFANLTARLPVYIYIYIQTKLNMTHNPGIFKQNMN